VSGRRYGYRAIMFNPSDVECFGGRLNFVKFIAHLNNITHLLRFLFPRRCHLIIINLGKIHLILLFLYFIDE
jgi:hypothetical protein